MTGIVVRWEDMFTKHIARRSGACPLRELEMEIVALTSVQYVSIRYQDTRIYNVPSTLFPLLPLGLEV